MSPAPLRCPVCRGTIAVETVRLLVCRQAKLSRYVFNCSQCKLSFSLPASSATITGFVNAGAVVIIVPAEVLESTTLSEFPPIDGQDLVTFALLLALYDNLVAIVEQYPRHRRNQ